MSIDSRNSVAVDKAQGEWHTSADSLASWAFKNLVNRRDVYGQYGPSNLSDGGQTLAFTKKSTLTPDILQRHFHGETIIGLQTTDEDGRCRWLAIDIDRHDDRSSQLANEKAALALFDNACELKLNPLLEDSNGRGGFHLWIIFSEPVPAAWARGLGESLTRDWRESGLSQKPEIFPKQTEIPAGGTGNWLRLFGKHHTLPHWSQIWDGKKWVAGEAAVEKILAWDATSPGAIPEDIRSAPASRPTRTAQEDRTEAVDLEQVRSALAALPAAFCDEYATWIRIGMCLSELGAVGLDLWRTWSQSSTKYQPGVCEAKWRTFKPDGGLTVRSLFYTAKTHGWQPRKQLAESDPAKNEPAATASEPPDPDAESPLSLLSDLSLTLPPITLPIPTDISMFDDKSVDATGIDGGVLPVIVWNSEQPRFVTDRALDAIKKANVPPSLFQCGNRLVRLRSNQDKTSIEHLNWDSLRGHLARAANWCLPAKSAKKGVMPTPPMDFVVRDILSLPSWPEDVFLPLKAIVRCPVFSVDGDLVCKPGYNARARLYFAPAPGLVIPPVPAMPSEADIAKARDLLMNELLGDFPFAEEADKANALAYLLTPVARMMISGPTPMGIIQAPAPGTGKDLLAACITMVTLGSPAGARPQPENDAEWRKLITAALVEAPQFIYFANLNGKLKSQPLEEVLTTELWTDRILGKTETITVPVLCGFLGTANNLEVIGDLPRRLVLMNLDAKMEFPEERPTTAFRHPNILRWAQDHRGDLLWSVLVLVQSWIVRGSPDGPQVMGSYESWAKTMGGILQVANVKGYLANAKKFRRETDEDGAQWRAFCVAWWKAYGTQTVTSSSLFEIVKEQGLFPDVLAPETEMGQKQRWGKKLRKKRNCCYSGFLIIPEGEDHSNVKRYRLEPVAGHEPPPRKPEPSSSDKPGVPTSAPDKKDFSHLLDSLASAESTHPKQFGERDLVEWEEFCAAWHELLGSGLNHVEVLLHIAENNNLLPSVIHAREKADRKQQLEEALIKMMNGCFGEFQILRDDGPGPLATGWFQLKVLEGPPSPQTTNGGIDQGAESSSGHKDSGVEEDDLLA